MADEIQKDFTHLNILVNNAGIAKSNTFINMTNEEWDSVMKINVYGVFYVTKLTLPLLMNKRNGGMS